MANKLKRCLWILSLFKDQGALSLKEINQIYQRSRLYDGEPIVARTFLRYKDFINETFPYYIEYNMRSGKYELFCAKKYGEDLTIYKHLISNQE